MKAVVCLEPGKLALSARAEPARREGHALVQVKRVGICGTDYHIFAGRHPYLRYPRVMGHELSGLVAEAGAASGLSAGEPVIVNPYVSCGVCIACRRGKPNCCTRIEVLGVHCDGGMCETISVPEGNLYPARDLTLDQAACVEFLAIGAHAVARAAASPGERALVIGAGPIGLGVALFASEAGLEVTAADRDGERLAFAERIGAASATIMADESVSERVAEATGGDGYDVVFDATGATQSVEDAFAHVAHGGALVLVSVVPDEIGFSDPEFHKREMKVVGSRNALTSDFDKVARALRSGRAPADLLITHRTNLDRLPSDLPTWAAQKRGLVKAMASVD